MKDQSRSNVAAVCGKQVRIYGIPDAETGVRPLLKVVNCRHYGDALLFAADYDESQSR